DGGRCPRSWPSTAPASPVHRTGPTTGHSPATTAIVHLFDSKRRQNLYPGFALLASLTSTKVELLGSVPSGAAHGRATSSALPRKASDHRMSMEMTAWHTLYRTAHAPDERRPLSAATLRRIGRFARPHTAKLVWF